jgi:hypothetical protein
MIELTRFQHLRPPQKITDEQKQQVGLPLYPDANLSAFANALRSAKTGNDYTETLGRFKEYEGKLQLASLDSVNPIVKAIYNWLDFKAKPIKVDDFAEFVASLDPAQAPKLEEEWRLYADALILAVERNVLQTNYCVDFQLLIRVCILLKRCLEINDDGRYRLSAGVTADVINLILNLPIVLPSRILKSRCSEHCSQALKMEVPKGTVTAEIDARKPCECKCDESCQKPSSSCICIRPYIADLFLIREELARFEAGDIADIENILAGEKKERIHRTLLRSETTTETETQTVTSEERDHEVNEKFSLQSEVKDTVDSKVNLDAGVTSTFKYGDAITITPHANVTANFSKSESQNLARSYAKDLVDRSVSKIEEKVRKLEVSKIISEVREKNLHSIDNTQPDADHRAGI